MRDDGAPNGGDDRIGPTSDGDAGGEASDASAGETSDRGGADASAGGTYTLVLELSAAADVEVGALGTVAFEAGWYAYTGSALGPGGFSRVERHRELAAGERATRHWHVDYLLGHADASVESATTTPADVECAVARAIEGDRVPSFGASDCGCESHLVYSPDREALLWSVERAHETAATDA